MNRDWWFHLDVTMALPLIAADVHRRHPHFFDGSPEKHDELLTLAALYILTEEVLAHAFL